ncbi:LacI family DNA-binding transcriptional regulator [Bifidobacterium samirii]|uniref:Transcriptional regulator, LacI family n=1 Tax=Bifidobacterium samirii TaxID=2306974 RepID=A0A430FPA6_9BIFI|nr:LacI family DNA-binding transcriptional regulator [Bifidobacterium samirii]RSX54655.1 transcriptional regulator, LacI family [Bifidobacterium samirii]
MVTLKQVAAEAGVSTSTASSALRDLDIVRPETKRRVIEAANRLDYRINTSARALRSGRSDIFIAIIPDLDNQYYARFANALSNALSDRGKRLILQISRYDGDTELRQIRSIDPSTCDGLFVCSIANSGKVLHDAAGSIPVLMFDDMSGTADAYYDSIETPGQGGTAAAINHLVNECGRRRIGVVGALADRHDDGSLARALRTNRCNFALQALRSHGLADERSLIACDWSVDAGIDMAHRLAAQGMPYDALCCMNDELALGIMRGLAEEGINVPDAVAVTGFDGITSGSYTTPTLTTVAVDFEGMAQTGTAMMEQQVERLAANDTTPIMPQRVIVGFQLLKRESTLGRTATTGFTTRPR